MGCGASTKTEKGGSQSLPGGTPGKVSNKPKPTPKNKKSNGKTDQINPGNALSKPNPKAAFRTPREQTPRRDSELAQRQFTVIEPILKKSVSFSDETGRVLPKLRTESEHRPILKSNSLRLSSSSFNAEAIEDYGEQLFSKLESLAGKIVEGYTPREEKPDRSELIIPEIKYGHLSEPTPRTEEDNISTIGGRSPVAYSAVPIWEQSANNGEGSSTSHICDVELLSSSRLVITRNGPSMAGVRLYDVTRDGHSVIGTECASAPRGVTVDRQESVIVTTDWATKTVKFIDYDGQERGSWKENKFKHPGGIARTREGRYIISDVTRGEQALREFSAYGKLIRKFGLSWFDWPWYLTTDSKGRVIVSERSASTIYIFDNTGTLLTKFGGHGRDNGKLSSPSGVTTDAKDNILVADSENYRVCMFSPDGRFIKHVASRYLARPTSLAVQEGHLVIATDTSIKMCELPVEKLFLS